MSDATPELFIELARVQEQAGAIAAEALALRDWMLIDAPEVNETKLVLAGLLRSLADRCSGLADGLQADRIGIAFTDEELSGVAEGSAPPASEQPEDIQPS